MFPGQNAATQSAPTALRLKQLVTERSGATAAGVARVGPVGREAAELRRRWLADGRHGAMAYLERYDDVWNDPALLLEGAKTVIMAAFSFANPDAVRAMRRSGAPLVAEYALGRDYHSEIRERLGAAARALSDEYGGRTRVCVDTAPLRERYWATRAGLGFTGVNNYLIIPGKGAHFVLGAVLWTGRAADYDAPNDGHCSRCMKCVRACPGQALSDDGRLDARKCLSYLTIESREPLPDGVDPRGGLFGCDICRRVCPHEPLQPMTTDVEAFRARPEVVDLRFEDWLSMTPERFSRIFKDSAVKRARLPKLLDTLSKIQNQIPKNET